MSVSLGRAAASTDTRSLGSGWLAGFRLAGWAQAGWLGSGWPAQVADGVSYATNLRISPQPPKEYFQNVSIMQSAFYVSAKPCHYMLLTIIQS